MVKDSKNKVKLQTRLGKYLKHIRDKRLKCQTSHLLTVRERKKERKEKRKRKCYRKGMGNSFKNTNDQ